MIRLFVIFALALTLIEARGSPKIQIFEIHDTENGLKLKKINPETTSREKTQSDLADLFLPRSSRVDELTKQLIDKLKDVRGDDIYKVRENPNLFILGKDLKRDENEELEEDFDDKTRNGPASVQRQKEILMQLMAPKIKKPHDRRQAPPVVLRNGIDRTSAPRHKRIYESEDNNMYY